MKDAPVLVVDLDGTLVRTDTLWESVVGFLRRSPWRLVQAVAWLVRGRAVLKTRLAAEVPLAVEALPYREEVLEWLREEHRRGRRLVLATAAAAPIGEAVARHLGIFHGVVGTTEEVNLRGRRKLEHLRCLLGEAPFEYVGNSRADFPLWAAAVAAHVVGSPGFLRRVRRRFPVGRDFPERFSWGGLVRVLRPHQWLKNVLVFLPLVLAHRVGEWQLWVAAGVAFCALSLVASGLYVLNDLLDVEADRRHPRKRWRPFACGELPLWAGFVLAPVLVLAGFGLAGFLLPGLFVLALGGYGIASALYSFWLKLVPLVDVVVLAGLYTVRLLAGGWATGVPVSGWLLMFAVFLFLSLSFLKRYVELQAVEAPEQLRRGYRGEDRALVLAFGAASGYAAVLVFVLYVNSLAVVQLYSRRWLLWLSVPLWVYWIAHLWLQAHRGRMHDDPLVFVLRDVVSYAVALGLVGLLVVASL